MGVPGWFLEDDEAFLGQLRKRRFEELRDTAQAAIELLDEQSVSLDELSLVVRRVRAMLSECETRIDRVSQEIKEEVECSPGDTDSRHDSR